jgi:hypothetical protein
MYDVSTLDVHREKIKGKQIIHFKLVKQSSQKNNQEFSLDGLREAFHFVFKPLGSWSDGLTYKIQSDLRNKELHGVRQVDVRTRTDVFLAGFSGLAK